MTYYYYIAADIPLTAQQHGVVDFEKSEETVKGFDFPIQIEIYNGIDSKQELRSLFEYICKHADSHKRCTFQIANLINSNRVPYKITEKNEVQLHKIKSPEQLLLQEGELLTIRKVNVVY